MRSKKAQKAQKAQQQSGDQAEQSGRYPNAPHNNHPNTRKAGAANVSPSPDTVQNEDPEMRKVAAVVDVAPTPRTSIESIAPMTLPDTNFSELSKKKMTVFRERMSSVSKTTAIWLRYVIGQGAGSQNPPVYDEKTVRKRQEHFFGKDFEGFSFEPKQRKEEDVYVGPKNETWTNDGVAPPAGETWESLAEAQRVAAEEFWARENHERVLQWALTVPPGLRCINAKHLEDCKRNLESCALPGR